MSEREEDLHCSFNNTLPCPNGCGLRNFQLKMREIPPAFSGEVSEYIANCPPRQEGGEPGRKREENGVFLRKYCLHFENK